MKRTFACGSMTIELDRGSVSITERGVSVVDVLNESYDAWMDGVASTLLAMSSALEVMDDVQVQEVLDEITDAYANSPHHDE